MIRKCLSGEFSQAQTELSSFSACAGLLAHLVVRQTFDSIDGGLGYRLCHCLPKTLMNSSDGSLSGTTTQENSTC